MLEDRRSQKDRRNKASRRRHADLRTLHVEVGGTELRVAIVFDDSREETPRLKTRIVRWRQRSRGLRTDEGGEELAEALRKLVSEERMAGCRVSFAINGEHSVNRSASGPSARVEEEITSFEERSQQYNSLGPGPKITAVARKHIDARHEHALVTVAGEALMHRLARAAESAGLVVDAIESSLVSLGRLYGTIHPDDDNPVMVAQVDDNRFKIGVIRRGELLMEYRPTSESTAASLGEIIERHHDRFQRFCRRLYGLGNMTLDRLWMVGPPGGVVLTETASELDISLVTPSVDSIGELWQREDPEPLSPEMASALGLALRSRGDVSISPNLMDMINAQAQTPIAPFAVRALAPIAATLLASACLWAYNLDQGRAIASLGEDAQRLAPMKQRGDLLSRRLVESAIETRHLNQIAEQFAPTQLGGLIDSLAGCMPDDVWLKQLRVTDRHEAVVGGASYTEGGVYDFVRHLSEAPGFEKVGLRGTKFENTTRGPATGFELLLELAPLAPAVWEGEHDE